MYSSHLDKMWYIACQGNRKFVKYEMVSVYTLQKFINTSYEFLRAEIFIKTDIVMLFIFVNHFPIEDLCYSDKENVRYQNIAWS
jgi:hypothetical protein